MGTDKERLFAFVGPREDIQRYQKLFDHLRQQGNLEKAPTEKIG